jgi:hypothetical protein
MQVWYFIALAVALFFACFAACTIFEANSCRIDCHHVKSIEQTMFYFPPLLAAVGKINLPAHFKRDTANQKQKESSVLSVFKGREAKLNRAIMMILFQNSPLVVYDITKEVKKRKGFRFTKYSNVNRRVRALVQQGYLESKGSRNTQSGLQGTLYEPTIRAKVAFYLSVISLDRFVKEANDEALIMELAALTLFLDSVNLRK